MTIDERLAQLKLQLPEIAPPGGNYEHAVRTGSLLFLAGKVAKGRGKLGAGVTVEEGYGHARDVGLQLIAVMKNELGSLDRVTRVVKVLGMVNAAPDFEDHPKVINGCSDLLVEVFGERGRHARSAVGMGSLPRQVTVEIEVIVEFEPSP